MRIAVLGPLEVRRDDSTPVAVPGDDERLLLASLAASAPAAVSAESLIGILGHTGSPEAARASLQAGVQHLRAALDPALQERSSGQYVLRSGPGYALAVGRGDVDALHATDLVARGRARLAAGDGGEAVRLLTAALALWRGEPFCDWPLAHFAEAERHRLAGVRAVAEMALGQAQALLARQPAHVPVPRLVPAAPPAAAPPPAAPARDVDEPAAPTPEEPPDPPPGPAAEDLDGDAVPPRHVARWAAVLAAAVAGVLLASGLSARSDRTAEQAATVADAERLAALSAGETPLDVSLLLAAEGFRSAETGRTRETLRDALLRHGRVERVVPFSGIPQDPVLSGGGRALTLGSGGGNDVQSWPVGPQTGSQVLLSIPPGWVTWRVAAGSPTEAVIMAAGGADEAPWIRSVSAVDGSSRLLLTGSAVGGRPVEGAVTPDGRRFLLLVAEADPQAPEDASRWRLIDVDVADGSVQDTGLAGTVRVPLQGLRADFTDDSGSFVMWDDTGTAPAALVDVAARRLTTIPETRGPVASAGFRAIPSGAAQLWFDGTVTLIDDVGNTVQRLDLHTARVRDVVVSPDRTWAATAGDGGEVVRWDIDRVSDVWSGPEYLAGHDAGVVGLQVHGDGQRLFSVSQDGTAIVWDMRAVGGLDAERAGRSGSRPASVWLEDACAVVGRDFTAAEWRRYLPDRPFRPTCTDVP